MKDSSQPIVDARNLLCPQPLLRLATTLTQLHPGQTAVLLATDPSLRHDLPNWCSVNGHLLLELTQTGRELRGVVQRGGEKNAPK